MAGGVGRARTNSSGSISPPTTGGNCSRWLRKHYAKNCQLKKLPYETIPPLPALAGRHDDGDLISLTRRTVNNPHSAPGADNNSYQQFFPSGLLAVLPLRDHARQERLDAGLGDFETLVNGNLLAIELAQVRVDGVLVHGDPD